jgi:protein-S-isoprenylcysteine O-methyltransferase Ste14
LYRNRLSPTHPQKIVDTGSSMIDHEMQFARHSVLWWNIKVFCGAALIGLVVERYLLGFLPSWSSGHELSGQILVLIGGALFIIHYRINRSRTKVITAPQTLVREGGLYRYVRHPMYLADVVMYLGFVLMAPGVVSVAIYLLAVVALYRQALVEDRFVASLFPEEHLAWSAKTGLMLPRVLAS